ncbi:hypothetical protein TNIN_473321 [Trichonephila inaurata madagascariensis]|uniref:Uncharacterized protein n=1 Tax=Trichonephila inaurata madagascariensis TaxID=2747483 RepID=A0A8X7CBD3_9ARAC|nr:hypothetical protein TNIN_473321 [Trichonephila inaurata madagascariensis]
MVSSTATSSTILDEWQFCELYPCYFQDDNAGCHVGKTIMDWYGDNRKYCSFERRTDQKNNVSPRNKWSLKILENSCAISSTGILPLLNRFASGVFKERGGSTETNSDGVRISGGSPRSFSPEF